MKEPPALAARALPLVFRALADPLRLRLLNLMSEGEVCVCHLGEVTKMVQPKISRHLAYLKRAGLVQQRRAGQWRYYGWAEQGSAVIRGTMDGLRDWMAKDPAFSRERAKLRKLVCP